MDEPTPSQRARYLTSSSTTPKYSFCESVAATGTSPWHIRQLDEHGPKYTGGITTESLCGQVTRGWDLKVAITPHHLGHTCKRCAAKYKEQTAT